MKRTCKNVCYSGERLCSKRAAGYPESSKSRNKASNG